MFRPFSSSSDSVIARLSVELVAIAVEFRRGAGNRVTTRDGQSIRLMEVFDDEGDRRAEITASPFCHR